MSNSNIYGQPDMLSGGGNILKQHTKGQKDRYPVRLTQKGYFECSIQQTGADIVIDVTDPAGHKIASFGHPDGHDGPIAVSFRAIKSGMYTLVIYNLPEDNEALSVAADTGTQDYVITDIKILTAAGYREKLQKERVQDDKIVSWLRSSAHPLAAVTAAHGSEDLDWLKNSLKNVRYAGLGEATHGTREFFQMKHRLLEFLVREMGFTIFAIEASYAGCKNINDYILYGKGDLYAALRSQGFWTWNTAEVADMIQWMRQYNTSVTEAEKIRFAGLDIQNNLKGGGIEKLKTYLKKTDPAMAAENDSLLQWIAEAEKNGNTSPKPDLIKARFNTLLENLLIRRGHYTALSGTTAYEEALQYATVIGQYTDVYMMADTDKRIDECDWRDYYIAANFKVLISGTNAKVVLWAHNAHICKNADRIVNGGKKPLGSYLKETYGDQYYAMGFSFNKGSFQARGVDTAGIKPLKKFTVNAAKKGSFEWYFSQTKNKNFIIDFRQTTLPAYIQDFSEREIISRNYGALVNLSSYQEDYFTPVTISKDFDAIIFINDMTRAQPLD